MISWTLGLWTCPDAKVGAGILEWFLHDPFKSVPPQIGFLLCVGSVKHAAADRAVVKYQVYISRGVSPGWDPALMG